MAAVSRSRPDHRRAFIAAALTTAALVYAWVAAGTTAFSVGADVVTAIPLGVATVLAVVTMRRRDRPTPVAPRGRLWPWAVLVLVVTALELVTYLLGYHGQRAAYPTISSLYDQLAQFRILKAGMFFGWLVLGWVLVRP